MRLGIRFAFAAAAVLAPAACAAFDSEAWLARRNDMSDAERLRTAHTNAVAAIRAGNGVAEGIRVELEYWPDGSVKTLMTAARGTVAQDRDVVTALDVKVRQFGEDGALTGSIDAGECTADRKTRSAWIEGRAEGLWDGNSACGENIYFSFPDGFIKITANPEFRVKSGNLRVDKIL